MEKQDGLFLSPAGGYGVGLRAPDPVLSVATPGAAERRAASDKDRSLTWPDRAVCAEETSIVYHRC